MKKYILYILLVVPFLFFSCNRDTVESIEENEAPRVHQTDFVPGDEVTRSSFEFDGSKLVFGWEATDKVGIFTTASKPIAPTTRADGETSVNDSESDSGSSSDNEGASNVVTNDGLIIPDNNRPETIHPEYDAKGLYLADPNKSNQVNYNCIGIKEDAQTAVIFSSDGGFAWDENSRWTAYYPLKVTSEKFNNIDFDFSDQTQKGVVDMTAYYNNTDKTTYRLSERQACKHISDADIMISPETGLNNGGMFFEMRHVGAIARFFLLLPEKKAYKLQKLELICESKIFYTAGKFSLKSKPYNAAATDGDFGLSLVRNGNTASQVEHTGEPTNRLELKFDQLTMNPAKEYGNYLVAYLMMYPITYKSSNHGDLFAYITAIDPETGNEVHFVTAPLADKDMISGRYYQWKSRTTEDDGLYPIELTATLLPWQDIVGSGIQTDLEK